MADETILRKMDELKFLYEQGISHFKFYNSRRCIGMHYIVEIQVYWKVLLEIGVAKTSRERRLSKAKNVGVCLT